MQKLAAREVAALDPYKFMALTGKRVAHRGGRDSNAARLGRAGITPASRVLDVGCGVGTTAIEIAQRYGCGVTAVDIAPLMVVRAAANATAARVADRVAVEEGDILALSYPDDAFDVVIAEAVIMFVDRERAALELAPGVHTGRARVGDRVLLARTAFERSARGVRGPGVPRAAVRRRR